MNTIKLSTWECFTIIFTIMISHTVLSLPRILLDTTGSATILNLIFIIAIVLVVVYVICRIFQNFPNGDILDVSEFLGGKVLKNCIGILFIAYFTVTASILLRNFCESIKVIYFPMTNVAFVILFFIIAVGIVNRLSFNATFRTNLLIIPLAIISLLFLFFANIKNFSFDRMFPILGDSFFDTFVIGLGNISAFAGIATLYFIPPMLKEPQKLKKVAFRSIIASSIYLLISVAILLFMFEFFIQNDETMPLYSATRYIEFGSFFQRLESIFLLIWMMLFAAYLSIINKFCMHIFQRLTNIKYREPLLYPFCMLMLGISLVPKNYAQSHFYESTIFRYIVWFFVFAFSIGLLLLANWKYRKEKKKNLSSNRNEVNS